MSTRGCDVYVMEMSQIIKSKRLTTQNRENQGVTRKTIQIKPLELPNFTAEDFSFTPQKPTEYIIKKTSL